VNIVFYVTRIFLVINVVVGLRLAIFYLFVL